MINNLILYISKNCSLPLIVLLTVNVICSSAYAIEQTVTRSDSDLDKLKPGEDISIQSYSTSFAKRMGLPKSKYGEPEEPIKGYEYRIMRALDGKYECRLNVYFDNTMDFKYPEGDVGAKHLIRHKLLVFKNMNLDDRRFWSKSGISYNMKIFIASNDYVFRKKGFRKSFSSFNYKKNMLDGVGFINIFIPNCSFSMTKVNHGFSLWLEKSAGKDYTKIGTVINPDDFNKYKLPRRFKDKVNDLSKKAMNTNISIRKKNRNNKQR